jgi:putative ATP-dependent endonuclease of OLD family
MFISKVSLVNYRNFANAQFHFKQGINTIIGENGSGKTNVFKAMRLLLEDSSYQFAYKLGENDFNRALADWRGHWIIISIEFDDITDDEAIQSLFIHGSGIIEQENFVKRATYTLFFRPKMDIRFKLSELEVGDKKGLQEILEAISIKDDYETVFTGKSTADFNDPNVYLDLVGDFNEVNFNFNIDSSLYGSKIPHQLSVAKEISFTFIQALRDVVADFHNNRTNPLLTLLKSRSGEIKKEDYDPISKMVLDLNKEIEGLPDVQNIRADIKQTIKDAVGATYSPSSLSIQSSVPSEADKLLQSLKLFIGEPDETYEGGIHELSLGGANLIFLTLKLLEYKYQKSKTTFANFLIIEEPEAHIHTHIQKTLFDRLEYGDTQIIYSTHSTFISEASNVANINILAKKRDYAEVYHPASGLEDDNIKEVQRYLDAVRSNLLFAKGVILVEGDAEEILIPLMVKKVLGISLDELGISLINIRSTGFENVSQLFHNERIKRKCSIVTDSDKAIIDTTVNDDDTPKEVAFKIRLQNSGVKGTERKLKLDSISEDNEWVKPFYAEYTFEVDFVKAGNAWEVEQLVDDVYKKEVTRKKAIDDLNSSEVAKYGKRVLTMANQEGKGWFAIMIGKDVTALTVIPNYILQSIVFAKSNFSRTLISDIIKFRIAAGFKAKPELDFNAVVAKNASFQAGSIELSEVITELKKIIPGDQLIGFLNLL